MTQQLVARIKRSSKYWGQTAPNKWFDVRVVHDYYHIRGNNNNYQVGDVVLGMRLDDGAIVDLSNGKVTPAAERRRDPLRNNPIVGFMSEAQAEGILAEMREERR